MATSAPRVPSESWGPSEWFGKDVVSATAEEREAFARHSLEPQAYPPRPCPHLNALTGLDTYNCNKAGNMCSTQRYSRDTNGQIQFTGRKVAICPSRIVSKDVLKSIAHQVLKLQADVFLVKEVPYSVSLMSATKKGTPKNAGRIDWLLVDANDPTKFCAVETQSVYMSGKTQDETFKAFIANAGAMVMPPNYRHPDYKSSVPKRLAPQLESKARHLSSSSHKTVVIVDEFVFDNMSQLQEIQVPAAYASDPVKAEQHKLSHFEVIFAIVSLAVGSLAVTKFLYCTVTAAQAALSAVAPMSNIDFQQKIMDLVQPKTAKGLPKAHRADKVFKIA